MVGICTTALLGANKAGLKLAGTPSNSICVAFCKFCPIITTYLPIPPVQVESVLGLPVLKRLSLGDGLYILTLVITGARPLSVFFLQAGIKATIARSNGNKHKRINGFFFMMNIY